MPFEISPKFVEAPAKVGEFQKFADAMLRGCAMTLPSERGKECYVQAIDGTVTHTCAFFAMSVGFNSISFDELHDADGMRAAYKTRYGRDLVRDYEDVGLTREEIAARIRAL